MSDSSKIEWTRSTFNPWVGCTHVSPGCENCYAETLMATRYGRVVWGERGKRSRTSAAYWRKPYAWDREAKAAGERRRVFCASLADVFDPHPSILREWRAELWRTIEGTPHLDWQLLTKRPERVLEMVPPAWASGFPGNVWLGVSAEDQRRAEERIAHLVQLPAALRFLSCEPLLGPLDFAGIGGLGPLRAGLLPGVPGIDWVIIGGESGPGARPCNVGWVRSLLVQCEKAGVAAFTKQLGAVVHTSTYDGFDGDWHRHGWPGRPKVDELQGETVRVRLRDPKGGDMAEWPTSLRVREFPEVRIPGGNAS